MTNHMIEYENLFFIWIYTPTIICNKIKLFFYHRIIQTVSHFLDSINNMV